MFENFVEWKILNESFSEKKVKILRTDNDLEYLNKKIVDLCEERAINRHLTVSKISQQNDLVERYNRTILEKVRCMLSYVLNFSKAF